MRMRQMCVCFQHRGWLPTLNGAVVSTELIKRRDVKDPAKDVIHPDSDHPQGISAPPFRIAPKWKMEEKFWTTTQ